jgi:zinc transport system permease protein
VIQFFADLPRYPFLQYALLACALASVSAGVVGSLIVVRRSTYIAGAIAHCVLGGMGAARYLYTVHGIAWATPMTGAIAAALLAALLIGWATLYGRERIDSILSIIWALGMSIGITFIVKTPGYSQDLMSYLFGSILMVSPSDLVIMAALDVVVIVLAGLFYNRIVSVCFHEEASLVRGIPVGRYIMVILLITALTTVLLAQIVGIVLVIALLTIPAATVSFSVKRLSTMMLAAGALCFVLSAGGLIVSYAPELPVGATIVELAGLVYLCAIAWNAATHRRTGVPPSSGPVLS